MQGAKTSKNMLSSERRVHLHESAGFRTLLEHIVKIHKDDDKIDPKMIENFI